MGNSQKITLCCFKGTKDGKDAFLKFGVTVFQSEIVSDIQEATFFSKGFDFGFPLYFVFTVINNSIYFKDFSFQIYYFEIEPPKLTILDLCSQKTCPKKPLVIHRTRSRKSKS